MNKPSITTIVLLMLLISATVVGVPRYFDNREEALQALESQPELTIGKCTISTEETIGSGGITKKIIATIELLYYTPDEERKQEEIDVNSTDTATFEPEAGRICEEMKAEILADPEFQAVEEVVVQITATRVYNFTRRQWENASITQN